MLQNFGRICKISTSDVCGLKVQRFGQSDHDVGGMTMRVAEVITSTNMTVATPTADTDQQEIYNNFNNIDYNSNDDNGSVEIRETYD